MISLHWKKARCFSSIKESGYNCMICNDWVHCVCSVFVYCCDFDFFFYRYLLLRHASQGQVTFLSKYLGVLCNCYSLALWIQNKSSKIQIPTPGIEPGPRLWEHQILTTRPRRICAGVSQGYCSVFWTCTDQPLTGVQICKLNSLYCNSLKLITYFWSGCSVIWNHTKAFYLASSTSLKKDRMIINPKKLKKTKTMKTLNITVLNRSIGTYV